MLRSTLAALTLAVSATLANAHFVFILPEADHRSAKVVMNEELTPSTDVPIETIAGLKLSSTDAAGHDTALKLVKADHAFTVDLSGAPARVIYGTVDLGVVQHGPSKPNWLSYYPKTIVGDAFDPAATLGERAPVELVPVGKPGALRLKLLAGGKPVSGGQVMAIPTQGDQAALDTDAEGLTPVIEGVGRYGFWARNVTVAAGEEGGKKYEEIRKYATLVIDVPSADSAAAPTTAPATALLPVQTLTPMPQPASSFGAVAANGYLYVYGGHIVDTHSYSTASVSGQFHRLNLAEGKTWEALPAGPSLQGMNLAAWNGKVIRVGGMQPQNKEGEASDVRSIADVSIYDPAAKAWSALPSLPEPRSSHDMIVLNDKLYVLGGWTLTGEPGGADWPETALVLDLKADQPKWETVAQPFKRRALIAATLSGKIYVIGGFDSNDDPSLDVNIFDPIAGTWTAGPALPTPQSNGFGPAAVVVDNALFASVGDGSMLRLDVTGHWTKIAKTTPRIVHRLAVDGSKVLVIGGAARQKQLNLIEAVDVSAQPAGEKAVAAGDR